MPQYVKQHYVPRFYLKNFLSPASNNIYCFDKLSGKSFAANIGNIAHENLFYGFSDLRDEVEQGLARVEQKFFVNAYNELLKLKNYRKLSHNSKGWLCVFLAFQLMRSKDTRLRMKELREKAVMEMAKNELAREKGIQIPDGLSMRFTDSEYVKALHIDMMTRNGVEPFFELGNYFGNKTWVVLRCDSPNLLWTSDNPLSFHNEYGDEGNLGIMCPGVEIRFPLSNNLLLFSYDPKTDPPHINKERMSEESVARANELQVASSTRFIYSSNDDFDLARTYLTRYPKYKKPNRSRWKAVSAKNGEIDGIGLT